MSEDCRKGIPDSTVLIRAIRERDITQPTRKIKRPLLYPVETGRTMTDFRFHSPLADTRTQLLERIQPQEGFFCTLTADKLRAISVASTTLEVCPDPTERDPYHALVKNIPTDRERTDIATRFAQLLAGASEEYTPPEDR
jgi:hypothetical protein